MSEGPERRAGWRRALDTRTGRFKVAVRALIALVVIGALALTTWLFLRPDGKEHSSAGAGGATFIGDGDGLKGVHGAIRSLSGFACKPGAHGWRAAGSIKNSERKPLSYVVRVSVIKTQTSEVLGSQRLQVDVEPGQKEKLHIPVVSARSGKGLQCVPTVVAGTPDR